MALLEVKDLTKTFTTGDKPISALEKLNLAIEEHEFVSFVGPSGCGKSTFLHIVGGFEQATSGTIMLRNALIGRPAPDRGMMFQDSSLFPWLTALQNVCWPLEMKGMPRTARLTKARDYLARYPKAVYMSSVESWRELPGGDIEFTMRRLTSAD